MLCFPYLPLFYYQFLEQPKPFPWLLVPLEIFHELESDTTSPCMLTMTVGSMPPPGYYCNGQLSQAIGRLAGPFEQVDPSSVRWSVGSEGSVSLEGPGGFYISNYTWYQIYRTYPSRKPSTITFTARYSCVGAKGSQSTTATLTINCNKWREVRNERASN